MAGRLILSIKMILRRIQKKTEERLGEDDKLHKEVRILNGIIEKHPEIREAILKNTEITRDHMTPELKLFLLTPNCSLYNAPVVNNSSPETETTSYETVTNAFKCPFWSIYWPGGQALTRFILDQGKELFGTRNEFFKRGTKEISVLDLGTGCGASAIAAKLMGARRVVANDIDLVACIAASMNAAINAAEIQVSMENLIAKPLGETFDIIFVGDLLYDERTAETLIPWLENAIGTGSRIYIGDPGRHGLTENLRKRLKLLEEYPLPENVKKENHGFYQASVWQFS